MGLLHWLFGRKKRRTGAPLTWERKAPAVPRVSIDEDGRRHRADAPYLLPKDEKEIQRLDYQHFILRQVIAGNCFAPVHSLLCKEGTYVLDVGCGTGRWGHEIARTYPHSSVYGFDLEETPRTASTPLNYQFYLAWISRRLHWIAHTETESIYVDEGTYHQCLKEHLASLGIEWKTWDHYMQPAEEAWKRQCEAENCLRENLDFWRLVPGVRVVPRQQAPQTTRPTR